MEKKHILSCIQPTGELHLGNHFGATDNWVKLQAQYHCVYGIADLHSMTMPFDPKQSRSNTISMLCDLIAIGVEPSSLFIQSEIPEHAELFWILICIASFPELKKQVQFKDKSDQIGGDDNSLGAGLFTYPVLQAADILLYQTDLVPVGKDQVQHLELSRNIAQRFNSRFGCDYFKIPEALLTETPKIMSLADPGKKMSKSLGNKHFIGVFEDDDSVRRKVQQAITSSHTSDKSVSPGVENLFELLKACENFSDYNALQCEYQRGVLKYSQLKDAVATSIINLTREFKRNRASLHENRDLVEKKVRNSTARIRETARKTLREVKSIVGLSELIK